MNGVFADTSYFLALLNPGDKHHARAHQLTAAGAGTMYTSVWVLIELGNVLCRQPLRSLYIATISRLRSESFTAILPPTLEWFDEGVALFQNRADKEWSMIDCLSFVMMQKLAISEALTADKHFIQAGFRALLAESST